MREHHRHSGLEPESIFMIFAFVFAFDSDSRERALRPNAERTRRTYMAASVFSPAGSEDVRGKGRRQRRKWIPAQGRNDDGGQFRTRMTFSTDPDRGGCFSGVPFDRRRDPRQVATCPYGNPAYRDDRGALREPGPFTKTAHYIGCGV